MPTQYGWLQVSHHTPYPLPGGPSLDEAFAPDGSVRPLYAEIVGALQAAPLADHAETVRAALAARGVAFGGDAGWPFVVDQVPRLIAADEWSAVSAGLQRRAAALEAFVADVHGPRTCFADGVVPPDVLDGCPFHEPDLDGLEDPPSARIAVAGMDLVRGASGELMVLEDNCRTPSGLAYALAARDAVAPLYAGAGVPAVRDFREELQQTLRAALAAARPASAPQDAITVLLSDGSANTAWWEHCTLAELAGVEVLLTEDLALDGSTLVHRPTGRPIAVAYRRTDIDRLREDDGTRPRSARCSWSRCGPAPSRS